MRRFKVRDAFRDFCLALFNREFRDATEHELRAERVLHDNDPLPDSSETRVQAVEHLSPAALLRLIYRYQFLNPLNTYATVRSYVDNAPRKAQFIDEFVQNAEDAVANQCRFEFYDDYIVVANDGHTFSHANLYALCSFRESDKVNLDQNRQIGKFGVGFKSIFRICRRPLVVTWNAEWREPIAFFFFLPGDCDEDYHRNLAAEVNFRYPQQVPERDWPELHHQIGYLFPVPENLSGDITGLLQRLRRDLNTRPSKTNDCGSVFKLPLDQSLLRPGDYDRIVDGVRPECFAFLQLEKLQVSDRRAGRERDREFQEQLVEMDGGEAVETLKIDELDTTTGQIRSQWVLRQVCDRITVPVHEFDHLDALARDSLPTEVQITLVVPLDERGEIPEPAMDGRDRIGQLFAGLPISSEGTGLNFHVNAPFNLTADRDNILDDGFNYWLIEHVADAAGTMLGQLRNWPRHRDHAYRLVPTPDDPSVASRGVSQGINQLFTPIHERLLASANEIGLLPALDGGIPLNSDEALVLHGGNARHDVSEALQKLFGGQPLGTFSSVETGLNGETIRFCTVPSGTVLDKLARSWKVTQLSSTWVEAFLADEEQLRRAAERDPNWFRHVFVYAALGCTPSEWKKVADLPWVPSATEPTQFIAPRRACILSEATQEELDVVVAAFESLRVADGTNRYKFASAQFAFELQGVKKELQAENDKRVVRKALDRLKVVSPPQCTWGQLVDELAQYLPSAENTPAPVLDFLTLAHKKKVLNSARANKLATRLLVSTHSSINMGDQDCSATAVANLWLDRTGELVDVPRQVELLLPRVSEQLSPGICKLLEHLAPTLPSPKLLRRVLAQLPNPSAYVAAWVHRVWQAWQKRIDVKAQDAPDRTEVRLAIGSLRLLGKNSDEWYPLADYSLHGFGKQFSGIEESLTRLFGPRDPDLRDYGKRFTQAKYRELLQVCKDGDEHSEFLPTSEDVENAIGRLSAATVEEQLDLGADLVHYLITNLEAVRGRRGQDTSDHIRELLRTRPWLRVAERDGLARPGDVVKVDDQRVAAFLKNCVNILAWPTEKARKKEFKTAIDQLVADGTVQFRAPYLLATDDQQQVIISLRTNAEKIRRAGSTGSQSKSWRLLISIIGQLLHDGWLDSASLTALRPYVDLSQFACRSEAHSESTWIIAEAEDEDDQDRLFKQYGSAATIAYDSNLLVRKGLVALTAGFLAKVESDPLKSCHFARRYRTLGNRINTVSDTVLKRGRLSQTERSPTLVERSEAVHFKV